MACQQAGAPASAPVTHAPSHAAHAMHAVQPFRCPADFIVNVREMDKEPGLRYRLPGFLSLPQVSRRGPGGCGSWLTVAVSGVSDRACGQLRRCMGK